MIDDTLEILTKQMIEDKFKNEDLTLKMTKTELYQFCIKLVKIIKQVEEL